jgi:hypothetical protein
MKTVAEPSLVRPLLLDRCDVLPAPRSDEALLSVARNEPSRIMGVPWPFDVGAVSRACSARGSQSADNAARDGDRGPANASKSFGGMAGL